MAILDAMQVFDERGKSLGNLIGGYRRWLQHQDQSIYGVPTLLCLLDRLQVFAEKQFDFFYDGFKTHKLEDDPERHPAFILRTILEQISSDLDVIQWAAAQRLWGSAEVNAALKKADQLTAIGFGPVEQLLDPKPVIVTFLETSPTIRLIPYASVVLIGVPFTVTSVPRDLLAIPHEIGHYLYWRGKSGRSHIRESLVGALAQADILKSEVGREVGAWLEEIFADVYGCLSVGQEIAEAACDLQKQYSLTGSVQDDGEHPVPIVRPHIYTKVLAKKFSVSAAQSLDAEWQCYRKELDRRRRQGNEERYRNSNNELRSVDAIVGAVAAPNDSKDYSGIDASKPVDLIIQTILGMPALQGIQAAWTYQEASKQAIKLQDLEPGETGDPWEQWLAENFDAVNNARIAGRVIKAKEWLPVSRARGWATRIYSAWEDE